MNRDLNFWRQVVRILNSKIFERSGITVSSVIFTVFDLIFSLQETLIKIVVFYMSLTCIRYEQSLKNSHSMIT